MAERPSSPERLWKYRPWNENTKRLITNGELYFPRPDQLNDPFEFRWREKLPTEQAEIERYVKELCAAEFPLDSVVARTQRFNNLVTELLSYAAQNKGRAAPTVAKIIQGVFCASEIADDILMWSHYAKNHTGVCVSIRPSAVKTKLFFPVLYSEVVPVIDAWEYIKPKPGLFVTLSRTKAQHWSYEKEWRTVHAPGPHIFAGCVDQVIMGAMMSTEAKAEVRNLVGTLAHEVKVFEARRSDSHYKVDIPQLGIK